MILLDTHVVVWLASGDPRLSRSAQVAINEARHTVRGLAISAFSLFELSLLFRKKQFSLATDLESFLREVERRFVILPITANVALQASALPANYPKDPADRIIGAADRGIRASPTVPTIW